MNYFPNLIEELRNCPCCGSDEFLPWGYKENQRGYRSVECCDCDLIYIQNRLNPEGLYQYYYNYIGAVHQSSEELNAMREKMYELEYKLIHKYLPVESQVLDVGCSGGYFLDWFYRHGHHVEGVKFGSLAAAEAAKKYHIHIGNFPEINFSKHYDLVVFRGVIEHVGYPKDYLDKARSVLKKGGKFILLPLQMVRASALKFIKICGVSIYLKNTCSTYNPSI